MADPGLSRYRIAVHGLAVELLSEVPVLEVALERAFGSFAVEDWPEGFSRISGNLRPYDKAEVLRHLSPSATAVNTPGDLLELYTEGERFWLVDDRWGITEMNLLKGTWRSWVLPLPSVDPVRCVEMAALWPMAQLLRPRGLQLIPAVSVSRGEWGCLILTPFEIEAELRVLIHAGYKVVGQRWTAMREEGSRFSLLSMPGQVERGFVPRLSSRAEPMPDRWVDLTEEYEDCSRNHVFCDTILIAVPGRRPKARLFELSASEAQAALRRDWPIVELHPQRRHGPLTQRLAQNCRCAQMHLSRNPLDFLSLVDAMRPLASVFAIAAESRAKAAVKRTPPSVAV